MKLKARNLNWLAGRPVIILGRETAHRLNVHVDERVSISFKNQKVYAVVDIFSKVVKIDEVGLSHEISSFLKNHSGDLLEIGTAEMLIGARLIRKKMAGEELSKEEIATLVQEITNNNLTESEVAYFVSAEKIQGMSLKEINYLVEYMIKTGKRLRFKEKIIADKHCIGGIAGNRTTPIVVSICTAAGLKFPKTSSRAITSASGTADVMETITNVELPLSEIKKVVNKTGGCLVWGGSLGLAPSDDKIIHVERVLNLDVEPQLLASIVSKKISAGSNRILIDIPYGGGKMKTKSEAKALGNKFKQIARHFKIKIKPVYTLGNQPIGNGYGPVLEMKDVLAVLENRYDCPKDLKEKAIFLSAKIMSLCGISFAKYRARKILESGKALEKFKQIVNAQNKKDDFDKRVLKLKAAKYRKTIYAEKSGKVISINNEKINSLCRILGTPESASSGVYLRKHLGKVEKGEEIITLYSESEEKLADAEIFLRDSKPLTIV